MDGQEDGQAEIQTCRHISEAALSTQCNAENYIWHFLFFLQMLIYQLSVQPSARASKDPAMTTAKKKAAKCKTILAKRRR